MSNASTRQLLGWAPGHPGLIADLDQGHYFAGRRPAIRSRRIQGTKAHKAINVAYEAHLSLIA